MFLIGLLLLVALNIAICILLSILISPKNKLNNIAVIASTFISPMIWHAIDYFVNGPKVLMWLLITFPVTFGISLFISASTWFILFYVHVD